MDKGEAVRLGREPLKLKILNDISGAPLPPATDSACAPAIEGLRVNFIDLPDLVRTKRASGRDQDKLDLKTLPRPGV